MSNPDASRDTLPAVRIIRSPTGRRLPTSAKLPYGRHPCESSVKGEQRTRMEVRHSEVSFRNAQPGMPRIRTRFSFQAFLLMDKVGISPTHHSFS
jgi:hypothetical protein